MPHTIVKPNRDENFYVDWSSISDAPAWWGPKEELGEPAERIARADATGTSALWYEASWEDDEIYIFDQLGYVKRSELRALCESLDKLGRATEATKALLHPFEDSE